MGRSRVAVAGRSARVRFVRRILVPVMLLGAGAPPGMANSGESEPALAGTVRGINWERFEDAPEPSEKLTRSRHVLANAARYGLHWAISTYPESATGDRLLVPDKNHEYAIRPATSIAVGLAVAIRTGVAGSADGDRSLGRWVESTARLIKGAAAVHQANGGAWGDHWQSSLWAAQLGRAGWMMWEDLDEETRELVCRLVVFEADRHLRPGYAVPYWNGKGGDSKAEENSWESMILQVAAAMLPDHPNAKGWKEVCSELHIGAFARMADMQRAQPVLDGKSPREWLRGYNLREDGIVINHGLVHNDYMSSIAHLQMQGFLVSSLAGVPVPETTDFNFDVIYKTLATLPFPTPPNEPPGGTMFIPGKAEQYYPQGTDWSRLRFACFLGLDAYADVLGHDAGLPHRAEHWRKLRAEKILEMQSRHPDGRMYADGEFDTYPGREQMVFWMVSDVHLLQWLVHHQALSPTGNWLAEEVRIEGQSQWKNYRRYDFTVDGRSCYLVAPTQPAAGKPWVWRARFPDYHPEVDVLLLERGFHVAFMDTNGMLGSPRALDHWDAFYRTVTRTFGLAGNVALEAVSRGGLFAYRWAAQNPERVACIYADTPVCDFKSWPLGRGEGEGNAGVWKKLLAEYGFTESEALAYTGNPVDLSATLAGAGIPLLHIVSLNDRIVPPTENTFVLADRYRSLGGHIEIIEVQEGTSKSGGHHFTHPDPERVATFIWDHAAPAARQDMDE